MKPEITFELVKKTQRQRFYKASKPLDKTADGKDYRYVNSNGGNTMKLYANKEKSKTYDWEVPDTFIGVVVSDAHTHIERLAFPMWEITPIVDNNPYIFIHDTIAGVNTFMIHGGDYDAVKPDEVYLRMLAKANGYRYKKGGE